MTVHSKATDEQSASRRDHIERRWSQLHQMEVKWGDATLNYLFLVSGGSAAATLTYIGNLTKDGTTVPSAAFWMLGCFSTALLVVGLLKISITYHIWMIFKGYRRAVERYYMDEIDWKGMLSEDEKNVREGGWRTHVLGWTAWILIAAGIIIGFFNLQKESARVRTEKNVEAATEVESKASTQVGTQAGTERNVCRSGAGCNEGGNGTIIPPSGTAEKEMKTSN